MRSREDSRQRILAISNAPGENSSPESATRSGQRTCPFFLPAAAIAVMRAVFIDSISQKSATSSTFSASLSDARASDSDSIFIFGFTKRSDRIGTSRA